MKIIPAIDLIDGKCVRLSKGDYSTKKIYNENPLEVALEFEANGVQFLHLVDLDGAKSGELANYKILENIAAKTNLEIEYGGGLKTFEDLTTVFELGASKVTVGSMAVKEPEVFLTWLKTFGSDKIILGADVRNGEVAVSGWLENSQLELFSFVQAYVEKGIRSTICTDISKDGMLQGPAISLYRNLIERIPGLQVIASGGIAEMQDLYNLQKMGCEGAIVGKAIYEGRISMRQLQTYILNENQNL